jgi:hypothetical protein
MIRCVDKMRHTTDLRFLREPMPRHSLIGVLGARQKLKKKAACFWVEGPQSIMQVNYSTTFAAEDPHPTGGDS